MDIGKAISAILRNTAGVSNYVGSRIFPQKIPFGETMPAITYFIIDTTPNNTKNGVSTYDYISAPITSFGTTYAPAPD